MWLLGAGMTDAMAGTTTVAVNWTELLGLVVSGMAGVVGGIVASINNCSPNELHLVFSLRRIRLGVLGDALIGFAAGVAVLILSPSMNQGTDVFRVIPLGLLAGIAGNRVLFGMSNAILGRVMSEQEKLDTKVDRIDRVIELISEGERLLEKGNPRVAEEVFRQALLADPRHPLVHLDLGKSFRHQADLLSEGDRGDLMKKAIQSLSTAIETSPRYDRAYYNRACYKALAGETPEQVAADLRRAVELFPGNRLIASTDPDFNRVRDTEEFKSAVAG